MSSDLPPIGTRLSHSGFLGTVRFVGPVDGTKGVWLGVEWDDPQRGKHDGVKDGKRYFTCLVPNSGSFIRPTSAISYGVTFLTALTAKYVELPRGDRSSEKVILGSSGGAIEVEAVNLDKIRGKLAHLERLREVSLDGECVSKADPPGEIRRTCPGIRGLDLSRNLISGWDIIADIAGELPDLRRLSLSQNRLGPPQALSHDVSAFRRLEELHLNATLATWEEFQNLLAYLPSLRTLELGYNRLRALTKTMTPGTTSNEKNRTVRSVNLDSNELDDLTDISEAMRDLSVLERLILTSNLIARIPPPPDNIGGHWESPIRGLKRLALAFNQLASWRDVDTIPLWCPALESLTLSSNPLFDDPANKAYARPFTIARIPSLQILNGAAVSAKERTDSELLYLSAVSKLALSDDARRTEHPQWARLCSKHGAPDAPTAASRQEAQDTLSSRLIGVRVHHAACVPPRSLTPAELADFLRTCRAELALRVLLTMTVRTFRLKVAKAFKIPKAQQGAVRLWMVLPDGHFVEMDEEYAGRDLSWWGVEDGSSFVVVSNQS